MFTSLKQVLEECFGKVLLPMKDGNENIDPLH
jgi:hypothetical protein